MRFAMGIARARATTPTAAQQILLPVRQLPATPCAPIPPSPAAPTVMGAVHRDATASTMMIVLPSVLIMWLKPEKPVMEIAQALAMTESFALRIL